MKERMLILLNSNVISQDAYDGVQSVVAHLNKEWGLNPEDDQYQIAMTHLARAADRIRSSESVAQGLDEEFMVEIKASENYARIIHYFRGYNQGKLPVLQPHIIYALSICGTLVF